MLRFRVPRKLQLRFRFFIKLRKSWFCDHKLLWSVFAKLQLGFRDFAKLRKSCLHNRKLRFGDFAKLQLGFGKNGKLRNQICKITTLQNQRSGELSY